MSKITPRMLGQLAFALLVTSLAVGLPIESVLIELGFDPMRALPLAVGASLLSASLFS